MNIFSVLLYSENYQFADIPPHRDDGAGYVKAGSDLNDSGLLRFLISFGTLRTFRGQDTWLRVVMYRLIQ
jgi:hypothetical protein